MCAIVGVAGTDEASYLAYLGLHALQHRGQEGAGIASTDGEDFKCLRRPGLVTEIFQNGSLSTLKGYAAIGHTRYSTSGGDTACNLQPLTMRSRMGWVAVAHNGNLTNAKDLVDRLEKEGAIFQTTSDTEVVLHVMARCRDIPLPDAVEYAVSHIEGAFSLLVMNKDYMVAVRDPHGFRPLVVGDVGDGKAFASETVAFELMRGTFEREVQPGEMVVVDLKRKTMISKQVLKPKQPSKCVFELIYFARPDSEVFGTPVYKARKAMGRRLAQEHPAEADIVIPVPDSGVAASIGYAEELGLPFEMGLIRSHYVGRTFIQPKQSMRELGVRLKLSVVRSVIEDRRVIVVDDSLVRGTTSKKIIKLLREGGAKEVHLRVSSPPKISPCFYGIDTPTRDQLIASNQDVGGICKYIGADSLGYLSHEGLTQVVGDGYCGSCFTGEYPTLVPLTVKKR